MSIENIYVGTCGWSYDDWKQVFYPNALKQQNFLEFYSKVFQTVEIDSSFYHIPSKNTVINWDKKTPNNFKFSAKLPQEITHKAKLELNKSEKALKQHWDSFSPLEKPSPQRQFPKDHEYQSALPALPGGAVSTTKKSRWQSGAVPHLQ